MSTPVPPDDPTPGEAVPDEAWLAAHAEPATLRRAPKLAAFVVAGALLGLVLGVAATFVAQPGSGLSPDGDGGVLPMLGGYSGVRLVTGLVGAFVVGLAGAAVALVADRRSTRRPR